MLLELTMWTTGKYLLRLTKKFGIDWLNKNLKLDNELSKLLYETVNNPDNPDKIGDLLYYLHNNRNSIETIQNEIPTIENLDEVKREPNLLKPGSKIEIYKDLIEEIFQISALRSHPIVVEGFLNGTDYLSYYTRRHGGSTNLTSSGYLATTFHTEIKIEKINDPLKRQERLKKQRVLTEEKRSNNQYGALKKPFYKIGAIYDSYFIADICNDDLFSSPKHFDIQNDYAGLITMKSSLQGYIDSIIDDVTNLRKLNI